MAELKSSVKPIFDEDGKMENKEAFIKREKERMKMLFSNFDPVRMVSIIPMIDTIAFQTASVLELEEIIKIKGFVETYQNGQFQKGFKETSESKTYIALTKVRLSYLKQLDDVLLKNSSKVERDALMEFLENR